MGSVGIQYRIIARVMDGNKVTGYHLESSKGEKLVCTKDAVAFLVAKGSVVNCKGQFYKGKVVLSGVGIKIEDLPVVKDNTQKAESAKKTNNKDKTGIYNKEKAAKNKEDTIINVLKNLVEEYNYDERSIASVMNVIKAVNGLANSKLKLRDDEFEIEKGSTGTMLMWKNKLVEISVWCKDDKSYDVYVECKYGNHIKRLGKGTFRLRTDADVIQELEIEVDKVNKIMAEYINKVHSDVVKAIDHIAFPVEKQSDASKNGICWKINKGYIIYHADYDFGKYILTWKNDKNNKNGKLAGNRIYEDYYKVMNTIGDVIAVEIQS